MAVFRRRDGARLSGISDYNPGRRSYGLAVVLQVCPSEAAPRTGGCRKTRLVCRILGSGGARAGGGGGGGGGGGTVLQASGVRHSTR